MTDTQDASAGHDDAFHDEWKTPTQSRRDRSQTNATISQRVVTSRKGKSKSRRLKADDGEEEAEIEELDAFADADVMQDRDAAIRGGKSRRQLVRTFFVFLRLHVSHLCPNRRL